MAPPAAIREEQVAAEWGGSVGEWDGVERKGGGGQTPTTGQRWQWQPPTPPPHPADAPRVAAGRGGRRDRPTARIAAVPRQVSPPPPPLLPHTPTPHSIHPPLPRGRVPSRPPPSPPHAPGNANVAVLRGAPKHGAQYVTRLDEHLLDGRLG